MNSFLVDDKDPLFHIANIVLTVSNRSDLYSMDTLSGAGIYPWRSSKGWKHSWGYSKVIFFIQTKTVCRRLSRYIENNVCTRVMNRFSDHKRVILVFISRVHTLFSIYLVKLLHSVLVCIKNLYKASCKRKKEIGLTVYVLKIEIWKKNFHLKMK